jgi:hypothetical protein
MHGASNLSAYSDGIRVFRTILYERFIVSRRGRRFPDRRLLTRMSGAPTHRQANVAGRSWAGSDSSAGLNGDGPRRAVRHPQLADLAVEPAPEAQAGKLWVHATVSRPTEGSVG